MRKFGNHLSNRPSIKKLKLISLSFFILLIMQGAIVSSAWGASIDVRIKQAYYTDIDDDGYEDDVLVSLKFQFMINDDEFSFRYTIVLTLPSGISYAYQVSLDMEVDEDLCEEFDEDTMIIVNIDNLFYNHATESGDYRVEVYATLTDPGHDRAYTSLIFDPPGATDGTTPDFEIIVY
jgi:hypothetical protein